MLIHLAALFVVLAALGCDSMSKKNADAPAPGGDKSWPANMQQLSNSLTDFFPLLYSQKQFADPSNEGRIRQNMEALSKASHNIAQNPQPNLSAADPGMKFAAGQLESEILTALENFKSGQKEFARRSMQSVVRNCVYCHSQNNLGPQFNKKHFVSKDLQPLLKTERADLLIANRDFEGALEELASALTDKEYLQGNPFEGERALRRYLALTVRVKKDPAAGLNLLDRLFQQKLRPEYLNDLAQDWKESLLTWQRELKKPAKVKDPLKEARRLIKLAQGLQEYPVDNSGDIFYLRATTVLHDYLQSNPPQESAVQALLLLGNAYEVLNEIGLWDVADHYYEACIVRAPHTKLARECYKRFEQSMYAGYSGSGGVFIPGQIRKKMAELKELSLEANPKTKTE